jgi:tRNA1(Val) A37 N6-methylase TrmN6
MHCDILRRKGHNVIEGDFLTWNSGKFSVIAMNPPYSDTGEVATMDMVR